jgi:hypothetical protein
MRDAAHKKVTFRSVASSEVCPLELIPGGGFAQPQGFSRLIYLQRHK